MRLWKGIVEPFNGVDEINGRARQLGNVFNPTNELGSPWSCAYPSFFVGLAYSRCLWRLSVVDAAGWYNPVACLTTGGREHYSSGASIRRKERNTASAATKIVRVVRSVGFGERVSSHVEWDFRAGIRPLASASAFAGGAYRGAWGEQQNSSRVRLFFRLEPVESGSQDASLSPPNIENEN